MESSINKIVSILVESETFLNNIVKFANLLGTPVKKIVVLKREISNGTIDYNSGINQVLSGWIARDGRKNVEDLVSLLKKIKCLELAEIIENEFPPTSILSLPQDNQFNARKRIQKIWNVAEPVPSFVGRNKEILRLNEFFGNERERLLVVSAMGGQGKTQLCRKWIQLLKQKPECSRIIWLAGESSQILMSSIFIFLKSEVAYIDESLLKNFQEILDKIPNVLEKKNKVLWVIDNVDTKYEEVRTFSSFLLVKMGNSKVIITSRLRTILPKSAVYLMLQTLSSEAAEELIRQSIGGELKEEDVKELCQETGFHALALQLSIGFIKCKQISSARGKGYSIRDFLLSFRENKQPILEDTEELSGYDKSVLHHVKIAMQDLNEIGLKLPQEIMKILSLLRFDGVNFLFLLEIVWKTVQGYGEREKDGRIKLEVEEALDTLHSLSLIQAELPIIQIHPLIQETTRILYSDWKVFAGSILRHVDIENLSKSNLQHILRLWEIVCKDDMLLREHASLVEEVYMGLFRTSQIQTLLPFTDSHRKNIFRIFGTSEEKEVIRAELFYGGALRHTGQLNEALTHLNSLLTKAIELFGQTDNITLEIEESKAMTLREVGRYEEAEDVFKNLLPRYITVYGEEHIETMAIKNNFAVTLCECTKVKEALELFGKVLQWRITNSGNLYQETLTTRHNIACCYFRMGEFQKATSEFVDILQQEKEVLGGKHFQTFTTREWMADILREMGHYSKAEAEYKELIEDSNEILGLTHPSTLNRRHNHANCLIALKEIDKAIIELEDIIELKSRTLMPNHTAVEKSKILLHEAEGIRTQLAKAEKRFTKCNVM